MFARTGIAALFLSALAVLSLRCGLGIDSDPLGPFSLIYVSDGSNHVQVHKIDPLTGKLTVSAATVALTGPSNVEPMPLPGLSFLGVADATLGVVGSFSIHSGTGSLSTTVSGTANTGGGSQPLQGTALPGKPFLYVPLSGGITLAGFSVDQVTGSLSSLAGSPTSVAGGGITQAVAFNPAGTFAYVAKKNISADCSVPSISAECVMVFSVDRTTGALTSIPGAQRSTGGIAPTDLAMDSQNRVLVVANFSSNNVQSFKVNSATGGITASVTGPYPTATGARYVAFHPNGNFVYIANNGSNSVSIFSIVPSSGNLATVDLTFVVAATPIRPVFDPTGEFMYVGSNSTNQLFGYRVDSSTGTLSALEGSPYDTLTSPAFAVLVQVPR